MGEEGRLRTCCVFVWCSVGSSEENREGNEIFGVADI